MSMPVQSDTQPVEYQDSYVGFLDLWGYKAWISDVERDGSISEAILGLRTALAVLPEVGETTSTDDYWVVAYSDSIMLRLRPSGLDAFPVYILRHALAICYRLPVQTGLFVRGAMVWGKFHGDDRVIFSPALVRAVDREKEVAHYPRVLLDEVIVERIRMVYADCVSAEDHRAPWALRDESDGEWFLNYLALDVTLREKDPKEADAWLRKHQQIIMEKLDDASLKDSARNGYCWLRAYHNRYCQNYLPSSSGTCLLIP